jgi:thiosulfate/3-mercaptopyruvate sulfurtransferase
VSSIVGRGMPRSSTIVDVAALAADLSAPDLVVCDCRHQLADIGAGERAYATGHVPGAHFVHLDRDLSAPLTGRNGRHPLPSPERLAALFGRLGIGPGTQVVAYDDAGGMIAARLWWSLRWLGHRHVALLDGGFQAWQAAGLPLTAEVPAAKPVVFTPRVDADALVTADEVFANLTQPAFTILDARSPDRFRGENETLDPVGGHIPGARNRFLKDNLDAAGKLKSAAVLREEFCKILGELPPEAVVHQCGSGVSACLNLLAMEHAGLSGSRLYAGSWSEWCSDPSRPVVKGA